MVREPAETTKLPLNVFVPPSSKTPEPDLVRLPCPAITPLYVRVTPESTLITLEVLVSRVMPL